MKITWYETFNAYWLESEDGRAICIGDGVDLFFVADDTAMNPGSVEFLDEMDKLCLDPETYEAYFTELMPEPPMTEHGICPPLPEPPAMTLAQAAELAMQIQNGCNLSGIAREFHRVLAEGLWPAARLAGEGTYWVNTHPISRLFLSKMIDLAEYDNFAEFDAAFDACKRIAQGDTVC